MTNLRDHIRCWAEDNGRIGDLVSEVYQAGYKRGQECHQKSTRGDGLSEVTEPQVSSVVASVQPCDRPQLVKTLTEFFNDPNRQAPQKATMHPDLEWLARRSPFDFRTAGDRTGIVGFYRHKNNCVAAQMKRHPGPEPASYDPPVFSLSTIEQARKHLSKDRKRDTPARREAQQRIIERGQKLRELEAERKAVLHPDNDPHIDAYVLGLNKLPDYETWFEDRGNDYLVPFNPGFRPATTVHELYTHFRARLLDELRQAGVIGDDS